MSITSRIVNAIVTIIIMATGLLFFLTYFKYSDILNKVVSEQMGSVVSDIKNNLEANMNLGLSLAEIESTDALINRYKKRDEKIKEILVFDNTNPGKILFSTKKKHVGQDILPKWSKVIRTKELDENWLIKSSEDIAVLGTSIVNNFGVKSGSVGLRYSKKLVQENLSLYLNEMLKKYAITILLSLILIYGLVYVLFRKIVLLLKRATESFEKGSLDNPDSQLEEQVSLTLKNHKEFLDEYNKTEK